MSRFCIVIMQRTFSSASISTNKDISYCNEYVFSEGGNLPIRLRFWGVEISTSLAPSQSKLHGPQKLGKRAGIKYTCHGLAYTRLSDGSHSRSHLKGKDVPPHAPATAHPRTGALAFGRLHSMQWSQSTSSDKRVSHGKRGRRRILRRVTHI
jgi:hypothetical protein